MVTFCVDASAAANVIPVIYINGAAGRTLGNGEQSARLESDSAVAPSSPSASRVARSSRPSSPHHLNEQQR